MKKISQVNGLQVGEIAPDFKARDIYYSNYSLSEALHQGEVVLFFIRGQWCSFCNKHLKKKQEHLPLIFEKGANVVVVSPKTSELFKKTIIKTGTEFTIARDQDNIIAKAYDLLFKHSTLHRVMYHVADNLGRETEIVHALSKEWANYLKKRHSKTGKLLI